MRGENRNREGETKETGGRRERKNKKKIERSRGERKLQRKKEGKRRTTVGLPLHRCHNAATEKGVSINRKKKTEAHASA